MIKERVLDLIEKEEIEDMEIKELFYDVFYKAVFGKEQDILLKQLKVILDIKERYDNPITIIGYELPPLNKNGKIDRCDIVVELSDDTSIHIEMNRGKEEGILSRNVVQVSRIYGNLRKRGKTERELEKLRVHQLNLNNFKCVTGEEIEYIALCEKKSGKVASEILSFCNVDGAKCYNMVYNKDIKEIPKEIRWGAILKATSIKELSYILGGDMLSMEDKERFLNTVREVNSDDRILEEWMIEENAKMAYEGVINTTREDGIEQGADEKTIEVILNMLAEKINYGTISKVTGKTIEEIKKIEINNK